MSESDRELRGTGPVFSIGHFACVGALHPEIQTRFVKLGLKPLGTKTRLFFRGESIILLISSPEERNLLLLPHVSR